jgi:hypothetical protein
MSAYRHSHASQHPTPPRLAALPTAPLPTSLLTTQRSLHPPPCPCVLGAVRHTGVTSAFTGTRLWIAAVSSLHNRGRRQMSTIRGRSAEGGAERKRGEWSVVGEVRCSAVRWHCVLLRLLDGVGRQRLLTQDVLDLAQSSHVVRRRAVSHDDRLLQLRFAPCTQPEPMHTNAEANRANAHVQRPSQHTTEERE